MWQQACSDPNKLPDRAVLLAQQMGSAALAGTSPLHSSKSNLVISDPIPGAQPLPVPPELAVFMGGGLGHAGVKNWPRLIKLTQNVDIINAGWLVSSRGWWVQMGCPWWMGQQESTGRSTGQMGGRCRCLLLGLHPLKPNHRASPRLSLRDRSATSTPTLCLSAGPPPPRIKTQWVRTSHELVYSCYCIKNSWS